MPKAKFGFKFDGMDAYMEKLDEIGGLESIKKGVDSGLKASKQYVNSEIDKVMTKSNMPAVKAKSGAGAYWTGRTKKSLNRDFAVNSSGVISSIDVGFNFKESGMTSIILMHGTPRQSPVKGLKAAIYGAKTQKEVAKIQAEAVQKVIERIMK